MSKKTDWLPDAWQTAENTPGETNLDRVMGLQLEVESMSMSVYAAKMTEIAHELAEKLDAAQSEPTPLEEQSK